MDGGTPLNQLPMTGGGMDDNGLDSILNEFNSQESPDNISPMIDPRGMPSMDSRMGGGMGGGMNGTPLQPMGGGMTPQQQQLMMQLLQQQQGGSFTKKIFTEFKEPMLGASLFISLNMPFIVKFLGRYIPYMVSHDGNPNLVSVVLRGVIFMIAYYIVKKFV